MVVTLALDQASKWLVMHRLLSPERPGIEVLPFFNIVMVWNQGISFGMLAGHNQPLILSVMSSAIVAVLLVWLFRNRSAQTAVALGFVIGGAVGNILDRLRFGAVADFLDFHMENYHWPAFNVADSAIFIGVVLLCIGSMLTKKSP